MREQTKYADPQRVRIDILSGEFYWSICRKRSIYKEASLANGGIKDDLMRPWLCEAYDEPTQGLAGSTLASPVDARTRPSAEQLLNDQPGV